MRRTPACGTFEIAPHWDEDLAFVNDAGQRIVVAREKADTFATGAMRIWNQRQFTPGCGYVTFSYSNQTYIAEAKEAGKLASLGPLSVALFAPPF